MRHTHPYKIMLREVPDLIKTVIEIYPFRKKWDQRLEEILSSFKLSLGAREFIEYENSVTESGREGYIGKAAFIMNEGESKDPHADAMWMDSSLHLFTLRVVDDFFDNYETKSAFETKKERLAWEKILDGTRTERYHSIQEEASVFLLRQLVNTFGEVQDYLHLVSELYYAVCDVEKMDFQLDERRKRDMDVAALTVEPVTRLMLQYGHEPSNKVITAIRHLARGARIWDHLGDLDKDYKTGAFNFILEEARSEIHGEQSPLRHIKNSLGRKYIKEANLELDLGEEVLEERQRAVYKTLRILMTMKYGVEYTMNVYIGNSIYRNLFHRFLRSIYTHGQK